MFRKWIILLTALMLCAPCVQAESYDADIAAQWLSRFAQALSSQTPVNDPQETTDPSRAGQVLSEYEFGTVLAVKAGTPAPEEIIEISVRTNQVTDCRGVRVGMSLADALGGSAAPAGGASLRVLCTQESGIGWSWAYLSESGVYGVEYISYGGSADSLKEYTLTYMIDENREISAIRMKIADATAAQAEAGFATAQEILLAQNEETIIRANDAAVFAWKDAQIMGEQALGVQTALFVSVVGEPSEIQTLPEGRGRILLYDGVVAELSFDEYTGVEAVSGVTVSRPDVEGPRGLRVGMTIEDAAELFACSSDMTYAGGTLYLAGEALGEPPFGEWIAQSSAESILRYAAAENGSVGVLEIGVADGVVEYWHLYEGEMEGDYAGNG